MYVFGGWNSQIIKTCEKYSLEKNTWTSISEMPEGRYGAAYCLIADSAVFVFGGKGEHNKIVSEVWRYDIGDDSWMVIGLMEKPHFNSQCYVLNEDKILIFGGCDKNSHPSKQTFVFCVSSH